jgi:hypothetical protein
MEGHGIVVQEDKQHTQNGTLSYAVKSYKRPADWPLPPPPRPVMGAQQEGGATYFTVCAPFSSDDPGQFYYNNTKDGNSTSLFAKHPTWVGDVYTRRPWFQTGLYYYDIKFSGAGVEVVSNEKAADAHGPAD